MRTALPKVIAVDSEKCVNCHKCIAACPVKFCNKATDHGVEINDDSCIGCGQCLKACTHGARELIDDFDLFMEDIRRGTPMFAVVAPAVASNFPGKELNLNGWLQSMGVKACFDVSFGAELTVRSYLEHVKGNSPACVIAQPCPAIVSYIQIYRPQLLPYLAPADSPMLHAIKMAQEFYPGFKNMKCVVISPCLAKKREFTETRCGDYNVTMQSINNWLKARRIDLGQFAPVEYANPPAERAVLFSTPGGLMRTAERWSGDIRKITRKVEGPEIIYHYLDSLEDSIRKGVAPVIVDCLNCEFGCNGGTATPCKEEAMDELESRVEKRSEAMQAKYRASGFAATWRTKRKLEKLIDKYWKPGLYDRKYQNLSDNNDVIKPNQQELANIYYNMGKRTEGDIFNCSACGYNSCELMATAIHNNLNMPTNCHHYISHNLTEITTSHAQVTTAQASSMEEISSSMTQILHHAKTNADSARQAADITGGVKVSAEKGSAEVASLAKTMEEVSASSGQIAKIVKLIDDIAFQTNLLALNASVEAARAGRHGRGFAVVANEVRNLAGRSAKAASETSDLIAGSHRIVSNAVELSHRTEESLQEIVGNAAKAASLVSEIDNASREQAQGIGQVNEALSHMGDRAQQVMSEAEQRRALIARKQIPQIR